MGSNNFRHARRIGAATLSAGMLAGILSACGPAPTTTYSNAAGQEVTVNWKDYPGPSGVEPGDILASPTVEDADAAGSKIMTDLKTTLTDEFGVSWSSEGESGWYPSSGNGYGGHAMTSTLNSDIWHSNTVSSSTADWLRIIDIANTITQAQGLGTVTLEHERDYYLQGVEREKELLDLFGSTDPAESYVWFGTAYGASQWLSVNIHHAGRDPRGKAAQEFRELGLPEATVSISYGATTVPADDLPAFKDALKPFAGLEHPEPTTSD